MNSWRRYLSNLPGWRTNRKLVVIESDDWGSIRMPSNASRKRLESKEVDLSAGSEAYRYSKFDTLANVDDLDSLFRTLRKHKDMHGNHPVFTAMALTANPDFGKIRASGFESYEFEPFSQTLVKYGQEEALTYWKFGQEANLFIPEFHGREHLNVSAWMRKLKAGDKDTLLGFDQGMWAINPVDLKINFQAAFDLEFASDLEGQHFILDTGLLLFEEIFERKAKYFVPPNGPINNSLLETASRRGIDYVSSAKIQHEVFGEDQTKRNFNWLGKRNRNKQLTLTRNCFFEPSDHSKDWVDSCLNEMEIAFTYKKPAVISSHRVNYIGGLDENNRKHGSKQLDELLSGVTLNWPEVEFITSVQLGDIISGKC